MNKEGKDRGSLNSNRAIYRVLRLFDCRHCIYGMSSIHQPMTNDCQGVGVVYFVTRGFTRVYCLLISGTCAAYLN